MVDKVSLHSLTDDELIWSKAAKLISAEWAEDGAHKSLLLHTLFAKAGRLWIALDWWIDGRCRYLAAKWANEIKLMQLTDVKQVFIRKFTKLISRRAFFNAKSIQS